MHVQWLVTDIANIVAIITQDRIDRESDVVIIILTGSSVIAVSMYVQ